MELKAQGKYIETSPIERIFTQGEAYADKLIFIVDAVNNGVDVSGCAFVMRTVACDGSMTETVLEKSVQNELVYLTWHIRDAVCIGFIANELISIIENAGLLGVPLPAALTNAIEILQKKNGKDDE